ncbi:MAG: nucleotide exchange factor GrpE [Candidatus Izemoplasmatales bacterium]|nr:nucleotide exchange factor GrpE [Candidatus Izemoplasmatales bacterium]
MSEVEKELVVEELEENKIQEDATKEEKSKKKKKIKVEEQLEVLEEELNTVKDKYYRALAEMENYKKRMTEDFKREKKYASMTLADKLIDSFEVFDQALNMETDDNNLKNFLYGFNMIKEMMFQALKDEGIMLIESKVGDDFDPLIHEAMDKGHDPEFKEHAILKVVKKGYKFKDRILRPTMVIINILPEETTGQKTNNENNENNEE